MCINSRINTNSRINSKKINSSSVLEESHCFTLEIINKQKEQDTKNSKHFQVPKISLLTHSGMCRDELRLQQMFQTKLFVGGFIFFSLCKDHFIPGVKYSKCFNLSVCGFFFFNFSVCKDHFIPRGINVSNQVMNFFFNFCSLQRPFYPRG